MFPFITWLHRIKSLLTQSKPCQLPTQAISTEPCRLKIQELAVDVSANGDLESNQQLLAERSQYLYIYIYVMNPWKPIS